MPLAPGFVPAHTLTPARSGRPDAPVVLIGSSIGTATDLWAREINALSDDVTVLAYEHPGHGAGIATVAASGPAGAGPYSVADLADALERLLDLHGIAAAHVVGLSLGGVVAQQLALSAPGRVSSLVLVCTAATLPPPSLWETRAAAVRAAGTVAAPAIAANLPQRWLSETFRAARPDAERWLLDGLSRVDVEGYAGCCEALAHWDATHRLGEITAPTTIVAGAVDPATPVAASVALRDGIPGARLEVVAASHLAPVETDLTALLRAHLDRVSTSVPTPDRTDADRHRDGMQVRRAVLGNTHVDRAVARTTDFSSRFQDHITLNVWGDVWTRPGLARRDRSIGVLSVLAALGLEDELRMHVRAALRNGLSRDEIGEVLLQVGVYAGVPRANGAFAVAGAEFAGLDAEALHPGRRP